MFVSSTKTFLLETKNFEPQQLQIIIKKGAKFKVSVSGAIRSL